MLFAGEVVDELHARRVAGLVMYDARDGRLVDHRTAVLDAGLCEVHGHARVVELAVVVYDASFQSLFDRSGNVFHYLFCRNEFRAAVTETERKHIVESQSTEIKEIVPVTVVRDDERLVFYQVRGIGFHAAAFAQGFEHQHDVAFLQVTDASVYQLRAAARGAFREVGLFEQGHAETACRRIDRYAESRCSAANDDDIPNFVFFG